MEALSLLTLALPVGVFFGAVILIAIMFRRVVTTNMTHIRLVP